MLFLPPDSLYIGMPAADSDAVCELVRKAGPKVIEVGTWTGCTARKIVEHTSAQVWCVDHWKGSPKDVSGELVARFGADNVFATFLENNAPYLWKRVFPCRGTSQEWARVWPFKVDLVFIDAGHEYEDVKADIEAWRPHVAPGGIICGHDHFDGFPGVERAVREAFHEYQVTGGCVWSARL